MTRKLRRICDGRYELLGGVCAGFGYYLRINIWLVRLLFFLFVLFIAHFWGVLLYVLLWIFLSKWRKTPDDFEEITGDFSPY